MDLVASSKVDTFNMEILIRTAIHMDAMTSV